MSGPFRDQHHTCPTCSTTLRPFNARLVCDKCGGMQLAAADLQQACEELAVSPTRLHFVDEAAARGLCPQCPTRMTGCRVELEVEHKVLRPPLVLARCLEHGPWFDGTELAQVFTAVERRIHVGQPTDGLPSRRWIKD